MVPTARIFANMDEKGYNDKVFRSWSSTQTITVKIEHTWTIHNFSLRNEKADKSLNSPTFSARINNEKSEWYLSLYPKGYKSSTHLSLYLYLKSPNKIHEIQTNYKLCIMNTKDDRFVIQESFSHQFTDQKNVSGSNKFVTPEFLFDEVNEALLDDKLTIFCEIGIASSENNSGTLSIPQNDLDIIDLTFLHESTEFSDVTLSTGVKEFPAHKAVLAARSHVFRTMFQHEMEESRTNRVEIADIEDEVLCEMLRYMYTGKVNKLGEVAASLICAAEKYSMDGLKLKCEKALVKTLSLENVTLLFILSDMLSATELKNEVKKFIAAHASVVGNMPEFQAMLMKHPHLMKDAFCAITSNLSIA